MNDLSISVIIPAYNSAHFLSDTLESVINQTYTQWECIIIDDGSTDNTKEVALIYCERDKRIKYIFKTNGGLSSARNEGLRLATGDYIQFLDADDLIKAEKFEKQIDIFKKKPNIDICYSNFIFFDNESKMILQKEEKWRLEIMGNIYEDFLFNWVKGGLIIPIHCPLIKHSFLKINNIKFDERIKAIEDWLFWLEISRQGARFSFVNEVYAIYRRHNSSMNYDNKKMMYNYVKVLFFIYNTLQESYKVQFVERYADFLSTDFELEIKKLNELKKSLIYKTGEFIILPLVKLKKTLKIFKNVFNTKASTHSEET